MDYMPFVSLSGSKGLQSSAAEIEGALQVIFVSFCVAARRIFKSFSGCPEKKARSNSGNKKVIESLRVCEFSVVMCFPQFGCSA